MMVILHINYKFISHCSKFDFGYEILSMHLSSIGIKNLQVIL
jgi:hypothetical protein